MVVDNLGIKYKANITCEDNVFTVIISADDISDKAEYIEIQNSIFSAKAGDEGYYVIPNVYGRGSFLCRFTEKDDEEINPKQNKMAFFGVKTPYICTAAVVEGMKDEFRLTVGVKNGNYYIRPRFYIYERKAYEDIKIKFFLLRREATYSKMAVTYREYLLKSGKIKPLKEKIKSRPALKYAAESVMVRIRLGWKKAPSDIEEQTVENEPDMYVACTFERVKDIIDELKSQGVDKAEICLVGWNKSGHDGRYPQLFPVEQKLGGKEQLEKLIEYAKKNGYQIVCHTNSSDAYSIADNFDDNIVAKLQDQSKFSGTSFWSGGRPYMICPKIAYEMASENLLKVASLGFYGIHYIDVLSVIPPIVCYDKNHPVNAKQAMEYYNGIAAMCHKIFGGFSSEGVNDGFNEYLDYGFYTERESFGGKPSKILDEKIPLWQIAYHGIILSNASTDTVNYTIKDQDCKMLYFEYGSRPTFYFYSKFMTGADEFWLGKNDLICDTEENLKFSVSKIKEAYEDYKEIMHLQTEFIEEYSETSKNVFEIVYSDKSKMICDHNLKTVKVYTSGKEYCYNFR